MVGQICYRLPRQRQHHLHHQQQQQQQQVEDQARMTDGHPKQLARNVVVRCKWWQEELDYFVTPAT